MKLRTLLGDFRVVGDRLVFGSGGASWSFPNVGLDGFEMAAYAARYAPSTIGSADAARLAEMADALLYLVSSCPTSELACLRLRAVRAALRAK